MLVIKTTTPWGLWLVVVMVAVTNTAFVSTAPSTTTTTHLETHAEEPEMDPQNNDLHNVNPTTNGIRDPKYYEDLLHKQAIELKGLGCHPMVGKITVASQLQDTDKLADQMFFPRVIAVARCHDDCSFCGNQELGFPEGRCVPDGEKKKPVAVFYIEGGKKRYRKVMVTEHTACKCA